MFLENDKLKNTNTRIKISENKKDESTLIEQFEKSNNLEIKLAALKQIQDETFHIQVVQGNYGLELRRASAGHIRNQNILEKLFKSESDSDVRHNILKKINNQDLLTEVTISDADAENRSIAISRLKNGKVLAELALDDSEPEMLRRASIARLIKLKDLSMLEQVFNGMEDGVDKTNVAGVLKQLGSAVVNDWIRNQRIKSDARQIQSLISRGNSYRAEKYSKIAKHDLSQLSNKTTQQEIYDMACEMPEYLEYLNKALDLLTDNYLLYKLVTKGITAKKGLNSKAIKKINDPQLLSRIASNPKFDSQTRAIAAKTGNIWNPFGNLTLICPRCGRAAIYKRVFESIDSYKMIISISCEHCGIHVEASKAKDTFKVGEDIKANLRDSLIFLCPQCGGGAGCHCNPKPSLIPVIYSLESDVYGDVRL